MELDPRRWTIFVCPECGLIAPPFMAREGGYLCESGHAAIGCEYVEVVPLSTLSESQGSREEQIERATQAIREAEIRLNEFPPESYFRGDRDIALAEAVVDALTRREPK